MEIWPAIDIRGGRCVRLKQGDYQQETVYGESPAKMARHWVDLGAKRLHLVDLDGAKSGTPVNFESVREIVEAVDIPCELGGGIRDVATIQRLLDVGVSRLVIGTLALKQSEWFRETVLRFPNRLVLGIDARNGMVATDGWLETSRTSAIELARQFESLPIAALVYTDISTDGMMKGPNFAEMNAMRRSVSFPLVASGGVTVLSDVERLNDDGVPACIIGRALYEGTISLPDVLRFES